MSTSRQALPEQLAFIERAGKEHGLLVAGPGTGKTWALAEAAKTLVSQFHVETDRIAVLTLTRSMAASLAERIVKRRP